MGILDSISPKKAAQDVSDSAKNKAQSVADTAKNVPNNAKNMMQEKADNMAKEATDKAKDAGKDALKEVGNQIQGGLGGFLGDLSDITDSNPALGEAMSSARSFAGDLLGDSSKGGGGENDSFHGKIEVGGKKYGIVECKYRFFQTCDSTGKPSTRPRGGAITFVMPSLSDDNVFFYKWMFSKTQVQSGVLKFVVYSQQNKRSYKTVNFKNAYCTELEDYFNDHDSRLMHTRVTISAESITVGSNDTAEFSNDWT